MKKSKDQFTELAGAVLDGTFVNWASVESMASKLEQAVICELKIVAEIAGLHRRDFPDLPTHEPADAQPVKPLEPLEQWGHLRILEFIGRGSFGEVYRAWNTRLDREVALKLLYTSGTEQEALESSVIQEGRLLARVQHPNVAAIYDADRLDGRVGLWMEFVHGRTLEQMLREGSVFEPADAIKIGSDLCRALSAVHKAGLLHRDVKAQNVMRANSGRIVLMDFGTGRELEDGENASREVAGTPLYLAPELFAGRQATVQSDIYAVGVLLYHLLTGSYPVQGATLSELRQAHRHRTSADLRAAYPGVSAKLVSIIDRALDPDPSSRFDSADEIAAALEALQSGERHAIWKAGRFWLAAAACVLTVILGVVLPTRWYARNPDNPSAKGKNAAIVPFSSAVSTRQLQVADLLMPGKPSPDGRYFSYTERNAGNLAVLDLKSGEKRLLTHHGDNDDYAPQSIFSADSRRLAYSWWSHERRCWQLRTVGIDGGESQVLFDDRDVEGFWPDQWSQDGELILGCLNRHDGSHTLALLSVADGSLRVLMNFSEEPFADLSRDGRYVVYDRRKTESSAEHGVYVLAFDGGQEMQIGPGPWWDSHPLWLPDGSGVVFATNRTGTGGLCKVAVVSGRPAGEPEILKKDMGGFFPIGLTEQGDYFYGLQTAAMDVYVAGIDPIKGKLLGSPTNAAQSYLGSNSSPDWSPDGRSLAFVSRREMFGPGERLLVVETLDTGAQKEFRLPLLDLPALRWSPDGRFIAFRGKDKGFNSALNVMDVQSGTIVSTHRIAADVAWSQDANQMYLVRVRQGLLKLDLQSQVEQELYTLPAGFIAGMEGRLSPDGRSLAFTVMGGGEASLRIAPISGGTPVELVRSQDSLQAAGWIQGGNAVLFTRSRGKASVRELWAVPVKGGDPWPQGLAMEALREIRVHPGGKRIAFTSGYPNYEFWVMSNLISER